jgi:transposase
LLNYTYGVNMRIMMKTSEARKVVTSNLPSKTDPGAVTPECRLQEHSTTAPPTRRVDTVDLRELKALELAARAHIRFVDGFWIIPSQTSPSTSYRVTIGPVPSCECDDFQLHKRPCKHILAARIICARDGDGKAPEIITDAVPRKPTYKQNWPLYDKAQQTEKHRFLELLFDLTRGLPNLQQNGSGRRWTPMSDMVFACALKVYTTVSSRRFACDLKDAFDCGYLSMLMNSVSVCAYLENEALTPVLQSLIVRSSLPLRAVETKFGPDSTGFSTSRFVRWYDEKYGTERSGHDWVKAHAIVGLKTNVITHVLIGDRDANDCPFFKPLVEKTAENFKVEEVSADKAYLSNDNLALVDGLGGVAYIPFKSNSVQGEAGTLWEKMFLYYQFRREEFLAHYHLRSNAETAFSMVKAKFRDHVRSRTDVAMKNEVLCKVLCHNIVVVHQSHVELGIEPVFWADRPVRLTDAPAILPFAKIG